MDALAPGRTLDAAIAEKVMGEPKPTGNVPDGVLAGVATSSSGGGNWIGTTTGYTAGDEPVWLPKPYSTEIAAAFEVVEKLALTFELGWFPADKGLNWDASFGEKRGSEEGTTTYAGTAPHAICLAALKVVEGALEKLEED